MLNQELKKKVDYLKTKMNGSSLVEGFGDTQIDIGAAYATDSTDESNIIRRAFNSENELLPNVGMAKDLGAPGSAGKDANEIADMKERLKRINMDIADAEDMITEYTTHGDKARKTLPVALVQAGDAYQMASSLVYVNQGSTRKEPRNILGVHDAQITAPGSTLLAYNAYNNISPYIMTKNSKSIFESLEKSMADDYSRAVKDIKANGKANIGMLGKYKALTGFFDKMYMNSYAKSRAEEKGRLPKDKDEAKAYKDFQASSKKRSQLIINKAIELGWLPPTERNNEARNNLFVSPQQWHELVGLVNESVGLKRPREQSRIGDEGYSTRNYKKLEKFKRKNAQLLDMMRSNKNQIINSK